MDRKQYEKKVVRTMIGMYCHAHHSNSPASKEHRTLNEPSHSLCETCESLASYCEHKIDICPLDERKTTCQKCKIHCYTPEKREQIRQIMRYAGPRMIYRHPVMAVRHVFYSMK